MISLEIVIGGVHDCIPFERYDIAACAEPNGLSDRSPSLWNDIIKRSGDRTVVHIFDREMRGSDRFRWLYDDISQDAWPRLRLLPELEKDFLRIVRMSAEMSDTGTIWLLSDYQFGPKPRIFRPMKLERFCSYYVNYGLQVNSAIPIAV
jgi:hypothetical protein